MGGVPSRQAQDEARAASARQALLDFQFDEMQMRVITRAKAGGNIFLTGVAGTGKSKVTERIVSDARAAGKQVAVAAPTGVAALNINGATLHKVGKIKVPALARDFGAMYETSADSWRKMHMLVLDEVGMVKADFLDWMDHEVRGIRGRLDAPFGGIQLIFIGDFAQLGPVQSERPSLNEEPKEPNATGSDVVMAVKELCGLAFQTATWWEAAFTSFRLTTIHRQAGDAELLEALLDVREANLTPRVRQLVSDCARPLQTAVGADGLAIEPTVLYSTKRDVAMENRDKLNALREELHIFRAEDDVQVEPDVAKPGDRRYEKERRRLLDDPFFEKDCQARKEVELKVGETQRALSCVRLRSFEVVGNSSVGPQVRRSCACRTSPGTRLQARS